MHSDTLADMLIRLKNASMVKKATVEVPFSKMNKAVLDLLLEENYVSDVKKIEADQPFPTLRVTLKYVKGVSAIQHLRKISKPGVRIYSGAKDLKKTLSGYGLKILTTNQGIMTDQAAKKSNVGGEVLAELW